MSATQSNLPNLPEFTQITGFSSGSEISGCFFTIYAMSLQTIAARPMRIKTEISHTVT